MKSFESPLVSVIVPVYNVERYLNKCIDSILRQSYSNMEVLLIDDGSPDDCPVICDEWAKVDSRIKVYHQANKGVAVARNLGLANMKGTFFTCVDPDDYLDVNYVSELVLMQKESSADIVFCGLIDVDEKGLQLGRLHRKKEIISGKSINEVVWGESGYVQGGVCKLIKSSIVKNHAIQYNVNLKNGEDWLFLRDCMCYAQSIANVGKDLYYCVQRNNSASSNVRNKFPDSYLQLWEVISNEEEKNVFMPWDNLKLRIAIEILLSAHVYNFYSFSEYDDLVKYLRKKRRYFLFLSKKPFDYKIKMMIKLYFYKQLAFFKTLCKK